MVLVDVISERPIVLAAFLRLRRPYGKGRKIETHQPREVCRALAVLKSHLLRAQGHAVEVAKGTRMQEPAEPVVFGGSVGIAQFSSDGRRLLILSGGIRNVFDSMRVIDVSPLYRTLEPAPENFEEKPVPPWLADIASAVSALDTTSDGTVPVRVRPSAIPLRVASGKV